MALPKQVRDQIAEAKRIETEMHAPPVVEQPPTTPLPSVSGSELPVAATPPIAATPPVPAAPQPDEKYNALMQQYSSLQGVHRTQLRTISEQSEQLAALTQSVQGLTTEVERLRTQPPAPPSIAPITEEEKEKFGPDLLNIIERKAQEVAAPLQGALNKAQTDLAAVVARNAELERALGTVSRAQTDTVQTRFNERVNQLVPDLVAINHDPRFASWLSQVDPMDPQRRTLSQRCDEAVQAFNADAVAAFFNTFKSLLPTTPVPAAAPSPNDTLVLQAQPQSRAAPDAPPAQAGRQFTRAEVSQFYEDVKRGRYTAADKLKLEREIFQAQNENRIAA